MTNGGSNPMARAHACSVLGHDILRRLAMSDDEQVAEAARTTLALSAALRRGRSMAGLLTAARETGTRPPEPQEVVFDAGETTDIPGRRQRASGEPPVADPAVNQAFDGVQATYDLYEQVFGRDSLDGAGLQLVSSVHYGHDFDNAFWNGEQMLFGDGSGRIFLKGALTAAVDVVGHELTHGVTQATAGLEYRGQPGALNESMSDVFGSMVKQRVLGQDVTQADWLIGAGTLGSALAGSQGAGAALRSLARPGTANRLDRQPADMADYQDLPDTEDGDWGGVHTNSGIPNRAFHLTATAIGGKSWEGAGRIWFDALTTRLQPTASFRDAAVATLDAAGVRFGPKSHERSAVESAWQAVGVLQVRRS